MPHTVVHINGLTRRFGETIAVDGLSLDVYAGEIFGFLGHNGAGKTTTVRLLNGVLEATTGNAKVFGLDPQADGPALRARTGVLTETPSLDERLTALDNLLIYADLYGVPKKDVTSRVKGLLAEFDLLDRANEKAGAYSKGMMQRLALARALLHEPELIFLDEPTAGLDPVATRHVHELVERLVHREGRTVFLCTHNLMEAQKLCDRVAVMEHGRLVALGTPAELTRQYVKRMEIEVEVDEDQIETAVQIIHGAPNLVRGEIQCDKSLINLTLAGREAIPKLLSLLVENGVRVYRAATQDINLEEVYFTLHAEKENTQ